MLNAIRKIKFGWIFILIGLVTILSGITMTAATKSSTTLLCFNQGCVYIQGLTSFVLGFLTVGFGVYMIVRK